MDIRNFFAKKKEGGDGGDGKTNKKKEPPPASSNGPENDDVQQQTSRSRSRSSSSSTIRTKKPQQPQVEEVAEEAPDAKKKPTKKKKRMKLVIDDESSDDSDDDDEVVVVVESPAVVDRTSSRSSTRNNNNDNKRKLLAEDDDDDDDDDMHEEETKATIKTSAAKADEDSKKEISASDYFANDNSNNKKKKRLKSTPSPTNDKKKKTDNNMDDDDDEDFVYEKDNDKDDDDDQDEEDYKDKDEDDDDDDDDDDYNEDDDEEELVIVVRSSPRKKTKTISKKKSPAPSSSSTKKKSSPPSSKKTKKPPPKPVKPPLLQPTLELDTFDMDTATEQCLENLTFCLTGVLSHDISRDDAMDYIKILGGRVTTAVSSKTDYLVCGTILEDGRNVTEGSKYKRAKSEKKTCILVHDTPQFFGLLQLYSDLKKKTCTSTAEEGVAGAASTTASNTTKNDSSTTTTNNNPYAATKASATAATTNNPYAKKISSNPYAKSNNINPYAKKSSTSRAALKDDANYDNDDRKPASGAGSSSTTNKNPLWVDKYKPTTSREILGNQESVRKLTVWLQTWEMKFNHSKAVGKTFSSPNGPWKAALLSGPPGIGKTTTATLVAQEAGRDVLEFNASDVRSKKALKENIGDITGSSTLQFGTTTTTSNKKANNKANNLKRCIIMDEVDGMGGGDRGGMSELIQLIKKSRVPIICICNDRQSQKVKSLLPYCMDLRYRRPVKSVIANRAMEVARREGLIVERNAAEAIIESCGNDVRQVLNCLQMWASNNNNNTQKNNNNTMTYKNLKEREYSINKDEILRVSLFDAARVILEGRKGLAGADPAAERQSFFRRNDAFFVDYSFVGLLVQQNYLKVMQPQYNEVKRQSDQSKELEVIERMYDAADCMSDFAVVEGGLRGGQNWSLLPVTAVLAVKTGYHAGGERGGILPGFPEFTTWLGRNSSRGKKLRLINELQHHLNYHVSAGTTELRMSYLPVLRERFLRLLTKDDNIQEAIDLMDDYGLDRDDIFEKLDDFAMDPKSSGSFQNIDSKKKAAFTRTYNQGTHKSQALVAEQGHTKKAKRQASSISETKDPDAIDDDVVAEEVEEEEDPAEEAAKIAAMFKKKGKRGGGKKSKAAAAGKGKGKATSRAKKARK